MSNQRGSVTKRNGSWGFSFSFHDESGVQRKIRKSDRAWRQKDAQKALSETIAHADAGHAFGTAKTTVADYLLSWLEQYENSGHVKQTTTETTRAHINAYLIPYIGSLALKDLRPLRIKRLYSDLLASGGTGAGKTSAGKPLSPKTVRNIAGTLHKALSDAVRMGIIVTNPTTNLDLPKWDRPEMKIWDESDIGNFLTFSFANDDPMFPIWMLLFSTGLRCGEVCGILDQHQRNQSHRWEAWRDNYFAKIPCWKPKASNRLKYARCSCEAQRCPRGVSEPSGGFLLRSGGYRCRR